MIGIFLNGEVRGMLEGKHYTVVDMQFSIVGGFIDQVPEYINSAIRNGVLQCIAQRIVGWPQVIGDEAGRVKKWRHFVQKCVSWKSGRVIVFCVRRSRVWTIKFQFLDYSAEDMRRFEDISVLIYLIKCSLKFISRGHTEGRRRDEQAVCMIQLCRRNSSKKKKDLDFLLSKE